MMSLATADPDVYPTHQPWGLVGSSAAMRDLFEQIERIARSEAPVLIEGETGCGKELVAHAIHHCSPRAAGPFYVLDCGSLPERFSEDQVLEAAHDGTLVLDHLGELPFDAQAKLLHIVESRNLRIIATTTDDLPRKVHRGLFRNDLYYRIAVARLQVPPLRARRDDIPLLVEHFVQNLAGAGDRTIPADFLSRAARYAWPGNVRELRNAVERYLLALDPAAADEPLPTGMVLGDVDCGVPFKTAKQQLMDEFDRKYFVGLLELYQGNLTAAARAAGIQRTSIYKVIRRLGVDPRDFAVDGAPPDL
jgi:DNA-binding NtrC family response regulator